MRFPKVKIVNVILFIAAFVLLSPLFTYFLAHGFSGPASSAGVGSGAISVSGNNVGIGTTGGSEWPTVPRVNILAPNTANAGLAVHGGSDGRIAYFGTQDYNNSGGVGTDLQIGAGAGTGNTYISMNVFSAGGGANNNLVLQNSGGNVGIGTTAPQDTLHVWSTDATHGLLFGSDALITSPKNVRLFAAATPNAANLLFGDGSGWKFNIGKNSDSGATNFMTVQDNGSVGIGNSGPSYPLDVAGSVRFTNAGGTTANYWFRDLSGNGLFYMYAGGVQKVQISTDANATYFGMGGNVGIGVAPGGSYKLEVNGSVGATAYFYTSDERLKTNIQPIADGLDLISALQGVTFNWKSDGSKSMGLVAQDVEKVAPELVSTDQKTGLKAVEYGNLVAPLIEAVKELNGKLDAQAKEIEDLKAEVQAFTANGGK